MSKLNADQRSALQSARAKNRKLVTALGNAGLQGVTVPKNIVTKIQAIEAYFAGILDAKVTTLPTNAVADAAEELAGEAIAATG